jgi:hypothetical protein
MAGSAGLDDPVAHPARRWPGRFRDDRGEPVPRHWVYDTDRKLSHKSGLTDFHDWYRKSFGRYSPWGDVNSSALVMAVETALERALSVQLMYGRAKPRISLLPAGATLVRQGQPGTHVYLVLDGVIRVERDGKRLAEYGPGALLGERAHLEGGVRTSTLVAVTPSRVAAVDASELDRSALEELSGGKSTAQADRPSEQGAVLADRARPAAAVVPACEIRVPAGHHAVLTGCPRDHFATSPSVFAGPPRVRSRRSWGHLPGCPRSDGVSPAVGGERFACATFACAASPGGGLACGRDEQDFSCLADRSVRGRRDVREVY